MSFISKDHFHMALKGVRSFLNQKADKSELDKMREDILDEVTKSGVQGNWSQNDPTQPDYIRNRTHYVESGEVVIEYDGRSDGRDVFPIWGGDTDLITKISDLTPRYEELIGAELTAGFDGGTETGVLTEEIAEALFRPITGGLYIAETGLIAYDTTLSVGDKTVTVPSPGVYSTTLDGGAGQYIAKLVYGSATYHSLNEKFIPDSIARKTDIPDAVPIPATAKAGQTIMVESVDENGKPTSWKSVDVVIKNLDDITTMKETNLQCGFYYRLSDPLPDGWYYYDDTKYSGKIPTLVVINRENTAVAGTMLLNAALLMYITSSETYINVVVYAKSGGVTMYGYNLETNEADYYREAVYSTTRADYFLNQKISSPNVAEVNQLLSVKTVDENGKPTEWEAVDRHVKLSELENDLLYNNSQVVGAFTKDDWAEDADGNCTYKFTPKIEGLTPENFEIRLSYSIEGEEFQDIVNAAAIDSEVLTFEPENYFVVFHPMLTLMHGCQFDFETEEAVEAQETTVVLIGAAGAPFDYFTAEVYLVDKKVLPVELMDPELIGAVRQASLTAEDALMAADEALDAATMHKEAIYPAVQNTAGRFRVIADDLTVQKGTIITVVPDSDPQQTSVYLSVNGSTYYSVRRRYIGTVDKYNNDGHSSIYPRIFPGGHPVTLQFTGSEWVTITSFAVSDEDLQKAMPAYFHCSTAATTAEKSLIGSAYVTTGRLILVYFSDGNSAAAPKINLGGTYPIVDNTGNPIQDFNFPAGSCYLFVKTNQGWMKV